MKLLELGLLACAGACWNCSSDVATTSAPKGDGSAGSGGSAGASGSTSGGSPNGGSSGGGSGGRAGGGTAGGGTGGAIYEAGVDSTPDSGGGNDAGDSGSDASAGTDVVGTITNAAGPAPNFPVIIDGVTYVTDAQGKFKAPAIGPTYEATVISTANGKTLVRTYIGLATRTPLIEVVADVTLRTATVNGQLSGGAGFPNPTSHRAAVGVFVPGDLLGFLAVASAEGPEYGPMALVWAGNTSVDTTLFGLQWSVDANNLPTAYTGWAAKKLTVSDGGTFGKTDGTTPATNLVLSPISDRALSGTATVLSGLTIERKILVLGTFGQTGIISDQTPGTAYQYRVPTGLAPVPNAFRVVANDTAGNAADTSILVDDSTTTLDVSLQAVPVSVLPLDGAVQIDYATSFTFTGPPNSVHGIELWETTGNVMFDVFTMGTSVKIPDFTSAGVPLKRNTSYTWAATADGPASKVEDVLVKPFSFLTVHHVRANSFSAERTFTSTP